MGEHSGERDYLSLSSDSRFSRHPSLGPSHPIRFFPRGMATAVDSPDSGMRAKYTFLTAAEKAFSNKLNFKIASNKSKRGTASWWKAASPSKIQEKKWTSARLGIGQDRWDGPSPRQAKSYIDWLSVLVKRVSNAWRIRHRRVLADFRPLQA